MVKVELLREVAKKASDENIKYTQADVENIISAYSEVILENLKSDDRIPMFGLGNWSKKIIKGREGVSALTGKAFKTNDKYVLVFKPSAANKVVE